MTMEELREYAGELGILSLKKFSRKEDLIRTIQLSNGSDPCFGHSGACAGNNCEWIYECPSFASFPIRLRADRTVS